MKKLLKYALALTLVTTALTSCDNRPKDSDITGRFIDVELEGAEDGTKIQLFSFQDGKEVLIDSTVVKEGQFRLETKTKELRFYYMMYKEGEVPVVLFLDEDSKKVTVTGNVEKLAENYEVTGSKYSTEFKEYQDFSYQFIDGKTAIYTEVKQIGMSDSSKVKALIEKLDSLNGITKAYAIDYIAKDPASPVSWMMLNEFYPTTGLDGYDMTQLENFDNVAKAIRAKYSYSEYPALIEQDVQALRNQIQMMEEQKAMQASGASAQNAPDIQLEDPNGNVIALSSLRGQVVLLDFWASWCKPCRQENPNVVAAYEKYKNDGFTIYSVSLDEDKAAWEKAIKADNLSWVNHVSDLKGWQSSAAALYGVQSIPASFLIDANGAVIGQDLRGVALEQKLQEVFGK
jgi:peroxiredoxin